MISSQDKIKTIAEIIKSYKSDHTNNKDNKKFVKNKYNLINDLIIKNKLFLNSKISLGLLSRLIDISEGYISQLINRNFEGNFNTYINSLRIEYAKSILADNSYNNYTIEAVGIECGFNSRSSFYSAFKKFTGKTPKEYRNFVRNL